MADSEIRPIPQVPKHYLVGNLPDVDPAFFASSIWRLHDLYGDIFQMDFGGPKANFISTYELVKDVLDDNEFEKAIGGLLIELRPLIKDGLFSAHPSEHSWWKAHRILMPVFGPMGVKKMFNQQLDIASQLLLRWDRFGPNNEILCNDDFTRLAFDTIGLCGFNTRFNQFYSEDQHPAPGQVSRTLWEANKRAMRTKAEIALRVQSQRQFFADIAAQHKMCDDIIDERIKNPRPEVNDLLNVMLYAKDPESGEGLDPENIRYQMITFMIAGHETTSGTLGFMFYYLLKNPETYHKAQQEVDEVLGTDVLTLDHLPKLKYIDAVAKESLRLSSPLSFIGRRAKKPTVIGGEHGKYQLQPDIGVTINLRGLHRDPAVWGEDAEDFKPERMLDFKKIPDGAWRPFGVGMRACIGRAFAEQEILINMALILQRFQVEMVDPNYELQYQAVGTIKPKDFKIKVKRRPGRSIMVGLAGGEHQEIQETLHDDNQHAGKPLLVLYGSNAGTCQAFAEQLISNSSRYGFNGQAKPMNAAVEDIPKDRPVIIITPSYEGKPADNAKKFVTWLEANKNSERLKGVKYMLFGVGNSEWSSTFHKVPIQVDNLMQNMGATRLIETGFVDMKGDTLGPYEAWCEKLWSALADGNESIEVTSLKASISKTGTAKTLAGIEDTATVIKNVQIADKSVGPAKMHMEVELSPDTTYRTGDYLTILPTNHRDDVRRVLARFDLNGDDTITITETNKEFLKSSTPLSVADLLASRVELGTPITQRQLEKLGEATKNGQEKARIEAMATVDKFEEEVLKKRFSLIDVLDDHPSCHIDFSDYVDMLKPMTARQYSISSCMLEHPHGDKGPTASITYDVHETDAWSGHGRTFHGVASSYLADSKPGSRIRATVRSTNAAFHLPQDNSKPIIMVAAGTGIAPMRGFLQERAIKARASGKKPGPALFYFGCRDAEKDYIYRSELEEWEKAGVVSMRPAFSQRGPENTTAAFKYTSDRLYAEKDEVADLFHRDGKIFICGSASKIAKSTADACKKIYHERSPEKSDQDVDEWLDRIKEDRYVSDVFG